MTALPRNLRALLLLAALVLALAAAGCGKKGQLVPPEALAPAPVANLAVVQKDAHFQVSWSAPGKQEGGAPLTDLAGFLLFRRLLLPAGEDCEECPSAYSQLARIELDYPQGIRQVGNLLIYDDFESRLGKSYQYKVRCFTTEAAQSGDSNKAHHRFIAPPPSPVVEALSSVSGVVLAFLAPPPEEGSFAGYNIYRSKKADEMPLAPLNAAPITGTTYEDKVLLVGVHYYYTVTSVASLNGETVESAPSKPIAGSILLRE